LLYVEVPIQTFKSTSAAFRILPHKLRSRWPGRHQAGRSLRWSTLIGGIGAVYVFDAFWPEGSRKAKAAPVEKVSHQSSISDPIS
jgi:hypothetical protein